METRKVQNVADPAPSRRKPGRPATVPGGKHAVKLRLDNEVLDFYKGGGPGWQTRINEVLRKAMAGESS